MFLRARNVSLLLIYSNLVAPQHNQDSGMQGACGVQASLDLCTVLCMVAKKTRWIALSCNFHVLCEEKSERCCMIFSRGSDDAADH